MVAVIPDLAFLDRCAVRRAAALLLVAAGARDEAAVDAIVTGFTSTQRRAIRDACMERIMNWGSDEHVPAWIDDRLANIKQRALDYDARMVGEYKRSGAPERTAEVPRILSWLARYVRHVADQYVLEDAMGMLDVDAAYSLAELCTAICGRMGWPSHIGVTAALAVAQDAKARYLDLTITLQSVVRPLAWSRADGDVMMAAARRCRDRARVDWPDAHLVALVRHVARGTMPRRRRARG
jgi:hypothetical protein